MNKVFRVIWNHATQSWVAVSELSRAKGKSKSKNIKKLTALVAGVVSVVSMTAEAANTEGTMTDSVAVAIGVSSSSGSWATSLGASAKGTG